MPARDIKTTFKLEGEQQYRKAMSDAASAIKELDSEQRLAAAQFEATGDAQQYAAEQTRILKEKIEEQRRIVDAARSAVEDMTKQGVDPNSSAMQKWRTKLNNANTKLTQMETKLSDTETELSDQGDSFNDVEGDAKSYNDEIANVGKGIDIQGAINAIDTVKGHIEGIIRAAANAAKGMWDMMSDAGDWADELMTSALVSGLDVETYQAWQYAARFVDTSVEDIVGARKKLSKNLDGASADVLADLNRLGVVHEVGGKLRDTTDVLFDIVDALGMVDDASERERLAISLLGKSYDSLNPLIAAGSETFKAYVDKGREDAVVSEERVKALGELSDANERLDAVLNKTKYDALAELAPTFTELSGAMATAVQGFNDFLQTEEGQKALSNLGDSIKGIVEQFTEKDFSGLVNTAAGAVDALDKGLEWIANHGEVVTGALIALGGAWAGLTVAKSVLTFLQLARGLNWIQMGVGMRMAGGAGAAGAGAAAEGVGAAGSGVGVAAGGAAGKVVAGSFWGEALAAAAPAALVAGVLGLTKAEEDRVKAESVAEMNAMQEATEALAEASADPRLKDLAQVSADTTEALNSFDPGKVDASVRALNALDLSGIVSDEQIEQIQKVVDGTTDLDLGQVNQLLRDITSEIQTYVADMSIEGGNVSAGFAQGIRDRAGEAITQAQIMAMSVAAALRNTLGIHSPSRVAAGFGGFFAEGFAEGIEDQLWRVDRAVNNMVDVTTRAPANVTAPKAASSAAPAGGQTMQAVLVMDGRVVGEVISPYVDGEIGAMVKARR